MLNNLKKELKEFQESIDNSIEEIQKLKNERNYKEALLNTNLILDSIDGNHLFQQKAQLLNIKKQLTELIEKNEE